MLFFVKKLWWKLSCIASEDAEPVLVDLQTPLLSAHSLHHVGVEHHLASVEHVVHLPVGVPVDGVVAHPGVLTLNVEVEVASGEGLEVPAEDSLELPVGGDLDAH